MKRKKTYYAGLPHTEALVRLVYEKFYKGTSAEEASKELMRKLKLQGKSGGIVPKPPETPEYAASETMEKFIKEIMGELTALAHEGEVTRGALGEILSRHTFALAGLLGGMGAYKGLASSAPLTLEKVIAAECA
jgi:hypothetical protein